MADGNDRMEEAGGKRLPRWAYRVVAAMWFVGASCICVEPFWADGPAKIALYAVGLIGWLLVAWPLAKTMGGNALRFLTSTGDVARADVGEGMRSVYGCLFPRRGDGFSAGFLVIYHVGMGVFAASCLAHPILVLEPWKWR